MLRCEAYGTQAVTTAPAGLVVSVATVSLAAGTTASGTALFLKLLPSIVMTKTQTALLTALVVAGVATPLVLQQRHEASRLRASLQGLQGQLAELSATAPVAKPTATKPTEEPALAEDKAELMRLRGEVARLRSQAAAATPRQIARTNPHPKLDVPLSTQAGYVAASEMQYSGLATPEAALQSYFWASEHPGSGKLLGILVLPDEIQAHLPKGGQNLAHGIGLPKAPGDGAQPAADITTTAGSDQAIGQIQGYRILAETDLGPDSKQVEVQREQPDGSVVSETHTLKKVGDEWKVQPGTPMQISFDAGDGKQFFFNSTPSQGSDGSQQIGQTVEIRETAPGSAPAKP